MAKYAFLRIIILSSAIILLPYILYAQQSNVLTGTVVDTIAKTGLANATVCVLNAKDSILVAFTRAGTDGEFEIGNLQKGRFLILISYPNYLDFAETFELDSSDFQKKMGTLAMLPISKLLNEVVITANRSLVIKKDTLEYDVGSVAVQPNARVEDIFRQLPGVHVNRDGTITAQGQPVRRILVDGAEFFGDDPTLVTKNIRADMVDKIQIIERKSDRTSYTGVDDGLKIKTINIKLKEDKKNGEFGKLDAGVGIDYYQGQAMYNRFLGAKRLAVYATAGNTERTNLNSQDNNKYTPSNAIDIPNENPVIERGAPAELAQTEYNDKGIPFNQSAGIHFDNKWDEDKKTINLNYKLAHLDVNGIDSLINQASLPAGIIKNYSNRDFKRHSFSQDLNTKYTISPDSSQLFLIMLRGTDAKITSSENMHAESYRNDETLLNSSLTQSRNTLDVARLEVGAIWIKKLAKPKHSLSVSFNTKYSREQNDGLLFSKNRYLSSSGDLDSIQLIDQKKLGQSKNSFVHSNLTYALPLSKFFFLSINYGIVVNKDKVRLSSFNQAEDNSFTILDSLYSNRFNTDQLSQSIKATVNYKKNKETVGVALGGIRNNFGQHDYLSHQVLKRTFVNFSPYIQWTHEFAQQKAINTTYTGRPIMPIIFQIQPNRNNLDPLNIFEGNSVLSPSYENAIKSVYSSYHTLNGKFLTASVDISMINNDIVTAVNTDTVGRSIYRFQNIKNYTSLKYAGYIYYGGILKKSKTLLGGTLSASGSKFYNIINAEVNEISTHVLSLFINASKSVEKKYSLEIEAGPLFASNTSSLAKELPDNGLGFKAISALTVFLPLKLDLNTDINYEYAPANRVFDTGLSRLIWNANLRRRFLKRENVYLGVMIHDILNQNNGFNRLTSRNLISQNYYTKIQRYLLLTVSWDFNKSQAR